MAGFISDTGENEYQDAMSKWQGMYGTYSSLLNQTTPQLKKMTDYYSPGGGYGEGQKKEAEETVKKGVSQDLSQMVSTGMSSMAATKGVNTLAGSELSKMYKTIEDTRNQLWQSAITPYAQMMTSLSQMASTMPTYRQYVNPIDTSGILQAQQQSIARNTARDTQFWGS
jgi:hypothetical protein